MKMLKSVFFAKLVVFISYFFLFSCSDDKENINTETRHLDNSDTARKRRWDYRNAPERMGLQHSHYELDLDSLPQKAMLSKIPWTGDYWPTFKGGITYRWNYASSEEDRCFYKTISNDELPGLDLSHLSPAEKFDVYMGDKNWTLTRNERKRTRVLAQKEGRKIPEWEGLCHAWAPATLMYENPASVTLVGPGGVAIPFGSSDIKALLTYHLHSSHSETYFASRRCEIDDVELRAQLDRGDISHKEYEDTLESANCRGINAGAFHVILTNLIALQNQGFIADVDRFQEVWNQPVYGYKTRKITTRYDDFPEDVAPGTVKMVLMKTTMIYVKEVFSQWEREAERSGEKRLKYEYWLELDEQNRIIGGTWQSEDRPDFLWKRDPVPFTGVLKNLKDIYYSSVSDIISKDDLDTIEKSDIRWDFQAMWLRLWIEVSGTLPKDITKIKLRVYDSEGKIQEEIQTAISDHKSFKHSFSLWRSKVATLMLIGYNQENKAVYAKRKVIGNLG